MSQLAPGRTNDMARLLSHRDKYPKNSDKWNLFSREIESLIKEGKDPIIHSLRERLIGASRASDETEIKKIEYLITNHVRRTDPYRYKRGWFKKG